MEFTNGVVTEVETRIIDAANKVFLKNGIQATTMEQIAEEAGISRTSLNYYFRSKKHLVGKVISNLEMKMIPTVSSLINNESLGVIDKLEIFVDEYMSLIFKYPMVPTFIIIELSSHPEMILQIFRNNDLNFEKLISQVDREIAEGRINSFSMEELFVNVIGLCIFPVISKSIILEFFFKRDEQKLDDFMKSHKIQVKRLIRTWLEKAE